VKKAEAVKLDTADNRIRSYRAELSTLERTLSDTVREAETLAHVKYTQWKVDKEKEKLYWLKDVVSFQRTPRQVEFDSFFEEMELRLEQRKREFDTRSRDIEYQEQRRIEYHRKHEVDLLTTQSAETRRAEQEAINRAAEDERHALERERIEAGRQAAEMMARALAGDLK
jgi:hypothetical protein